MPNQFSITPAGDMSRGLAGLSSVLEDVRANRQEAAEKKRVEDLKAQAAEVFATNDPYAIAEFSVSNPEMASILKGSMDIRDGAQEKEQISLFVDTLSDPANAKERLIRHIQTVERRGDNADNSRKALQTLVEQGPEAYAAITKNAFAGTFPTRFNAFEKATSEVPAGRADAFAKINPKDFTPESVAEFQKTGDFASLQAITENEGAVTTLNPEKAASYGFPEGAIVQQKADGAFNVVFQPETDTKARDDKIANLVAQGLDQETATNMVDGFVRIEANPVSGKMTITNEVTKSVTEVPIQGGPEGERAKPEQTLYELASLATGLGSGISELVSEVSGTFGGPVDEPVIYARQQFNLAQNGLIQSLAITDELGTKEVQRIKEMTKLDPSILRSPPATQVRLRAIDNQLRFTQDQYRRAAQDPALGEAERGKFVRNAETISQYLAKLGVPEAIDPKLFSNTETLNQVPVSELQNYVRSASEAELNNLPEEARKNLYKRLTSE
jgi:hypothetical protein